MLRLLLLLPPPASARSVVFLFVVSSYARTAGPSFSPLPPTPLILGLGLAFKKNMDRSISSLKTGMPYYKSTDSPLSRAGVDGAECILHVWHNSILTQKDSESKMTGLPMAAGAGTANKYGQHGYDFYVRDAKYRNQQTRAGVGINPYIGNNKMRSAVVQLATDVQRWRCMDDIRSTTVAGKTTYLPCKAWEGDDSIAVRFEWSE
jgi:hypothetical protein